MRFIMIAFTDYPILQLGDKPRTQAPIRQVKIISYDGDKRCRVMIADLEFDIKCCYLYSQPGRLGEVETIDINKL